MPEIEILYEDNHVIAVKKPSGLLTQETKEEHDSLENRVKALLKAKYEKPGNVFLGVIHRLDKPVSGIVLFAKTSKALTRLNESIRSKEMHKTYTALVQGVVVSKSPILSTTLEHYLKHDDYRATVCQKTDPQSKLARLHYKVLSQFKSSTLVEIQLETGRYHQIRAQFSSIGHPIVGDVKYGSTLMLPVDGIALAHTKLIFQHPVTKTSIEVICTFETWPQL